MILHILLDNHILLTVLIEGLATSAFSSGVRIREFESRAHDAFFVVDFYSENMQKAFPTNDQWVLFIDMNHFVVFVWLLVGGFEMVIEPVAPTTLYGE